MRRTAERPYVRVQPDGCWIWQRAVARKAAPYGRVIHGGRLKQAHRVVYEAMVGPIPDGLHLDHLCRVPSCVNPAHLEPVTVQENIHRGMVTKFDWATVHEIRENYAQGHTTYAALGRKYGVTDRTISHIVRGIIWKEAA